MLQVLNIESLVFVDSYFQIDFAQIYFFLYFEISVFFYNNDFKISVFTH